MKHCPVCDTKFTDEEIRFCTKDGTPLIEDGEPKFTEMPSESLGDQPQDDDGEKTQIRSSRDPNEGLPPVVPSSERIVIPTAPPVREPAVRPRPQPYYPPPPPPNTAKTVVLTVIGTLLVLGAGAGLFWLLQGSEPANRNINVNTNFNANVNTNLGFDSNFNFNVPSNLNTNYNLNTNFNFNANVRSPTPTPTPRPSPSITPSPSPTPTAAPTRTPAFNVRPGTPTPTPRQGPRPTASPDGGDGKR